METKLYKTHHFWKRAWERGFDQKQIDKIMSEAKNIKKKTLVIFGKQKLKEAGIKIKGSSHLIIVAKNNVLITLFEVPDLFNYLKENANKYSLLIL